MSDFTDEYYNQLVNYGGYALPRYNVEKSLCGSCFTDVENLLL